MPRLATPLKRAVLAALGLTLVATAFGTAAPAFAITTDTLAAGQTLQAGHSLVSTSGAYTAAMQTDGNLVEYGPTGVIWASNTGGSGSNDFLGMQGDGNLVLYRQGGVPLWATGTNPSSSDKLIMQNDGNLVVYSGAGKALWANSGNRPSTLYSGHQLNVNQSLYSPTGGYQAVMQGDGNFVVYGPTGAIWASNTGGSNDFIAMQGDGNLVIYQPGGHPVWSSSTNPSSNDRLVMQGDGNLVIYNGAGQAVWASKSSKGVIGAPSGGTSSTAVDAFVSKYNNVLVGTGQCVALFNAYNSQVVGAGFVPATYAYQLYDNAPSTYYTRISAGSTPQKGDVAIYGSNMPYSGGAGHVAIVLGQVSATTLQVFDQNDPIGHASWSHTLSTAYLRGYLRPHS